MANVLERPMTSSYGEEFVADRNPSRLKLLTEKAEEQRNRILDCASLAGRMADQLFGTIPENDTASGTRASPPGTLGDLEGAADRVDQALEVLWVQLSRFEKNGLT